MNDPMVGSRILDTAAAESSIVIMNTDIGYDPDDIVALAIAALTVKHLVVITADETGGRRKRLARLLLDEMDRPDVPVLAGKDLGGSQRFVMDEVLPEVPHHQLLDDSESDEPEDDVIGMISDLCSTSTQPIVWLGQGPMSDVAEVLTICPDLTEQLSVTQMGGWLDSYRDKSRASHNFRIDPRAAGLALRMLDRPRLVLSDVTNMPDIRVTAASELYQRLAAPDAPTWARLVAHNFECWFTRKSGCWLHDPLTLSAALGLPFVEFVDEQVRIERDTRLYRDPEGRTLQVATGADYVGFWEWVATTAGCAAAPAVDDGDSLHHRISGWEN